MTTLPRSRWHARLVLLSVVLFAIALPGGAHGAKPLVPVVSIPLEPLGFYGVPARLILTRATMYSVHFVDAAHILFTFNSRGLIKRTDDAAFGDDDRNVTAMLLEVPSGKVLAQTDWHTRDHSQYLWPLGRGRFLLRIRTRITVIDPMRRLAEGDAFKQQPLLDPHRFFGFLSVSPSGDLIALETVPRPRPRSPSRLAAPPSLAQELTEEEELDKRVPVRIHFYRLLESAAVLPPGSSEARSKGEPNLLVARSAGTIFSPTLINVPVTAEGYLDVVKESNAVYNFDFRSHAGSKMELSAFDTSCFPRPYFLSKSEFLAFGCRGGTDRRLMSGFNLMGEEPWVQNFSEDYTSPIVLPVPEAGRFALSRVLVSSALSVDPDMLNPENLTTQEITVLQNHDGRILLKLQVTPIQMNGGNFDLAPDGRSLMVVRGGNLEIYGVPALTIKDHSEVARAALAIPAKNEAVISLGSAPVKHRSEATAEGVPLGGEVLKPAPVDALPKAAAAVSPVNPQPSEHATPVAEQNTSIVGDVPANHRKVPSLYDAEHPKEGKPKP